MAKKIKATTAQQQVHAMDILIRAALTNSKERPLSSEIEPMLEALPPGDDEQVGFIFVMLACMAVRDNERWIKILNEFLNGALMDEDAETLREENV